MMNLTCDTDGFVKGAYLYNKKEREKFIDKVADITEDEEIQLIMVIAKI